MGLHIDTTQAQTVEYAGAKGKGPCRRQPGTIPGIELPLIVTDENRIIAGFLLFSAASVLYLLSNHFPILEPRQLPMWAWDRTIPFLPHTIWIYISEYIYFVLIYCLCRNTVNLNKYLYSFISLQSVSVLIFMLWPTTYPRELYPVPEGLGFWTNLAWTTLRVGDNPGNCCPSLHVSSVLLCGMLFLNEQRRKLPFFLAWGTAIAVSTLTTKQHYIIDVMTGIAMACLFHWIFNYKVCYRPLKKV
ncbi:MAG: phosphatase PAP2 family protein [Oligoflexia bacterium]|nr:phosphatase PAP2 family protein [Oligoflexia bacterium]